MSKCNLLWKVTTSWAITLFCVILQSLYGIHRFLNCQTKLCRVQLWEFNWGNSYYGCHGPCVSQSHRSTTTRPHHVLMNIHDLRKVLPVLSCDCNLCWHCVVLITATHSQRLVQEVSWILMAAVRGVMRILRQRYGCGGLLYEVAESLWRIYWPIIRLSACILNRSLSLNNQQTWGWVTVVLNN